jgi:hypothetical protein
MSAPLDRATRRSIAAALVTGFLVFNVLFSLLVSRGEKQYFWDQARYELGLVPKPSLSDRMSQTIDDALWRAGTWGVLVAGAGIASVAYVARAARRRESENDS